MAEAYGRARRGEQGRAHSRVGDGRSAFEEADFHAEAEIGKILQAQ